MQVNFVDAQGTTTLHLAASKGMEMAWVAQSIKHQQLTFLKDLRVETYEAYGEYVCGDKVATMQRDDGQYPAWDNVMEADLATRNDWWEDVIVRKLSLNYAILKSIGENETSEPYIVTLIAK